jgi:hypothetical protein
MTLLEREGGAMYDLLTTDELTMLQRMLYDGTEEAYKVTRSRDEEPDWPGRYRPVHRELGHLFIEAGTELVERLDTHPTAA